MNNKILKVENLSKVYKEKKNNKVTALDNISYEFNNNQIIGLLGKNGAGKTTFIKSCCNLITYKGKIYYNNKLVSKKNNNLNSYFSAVLEGNRNIYWKLTVMENIEYFASLRLKKKNEIIEIANVLLKKLYLYDKKDMLVETLSKGMKQKAALICALVLSTPVLFLDEPTLGLDVESINQMIDFFNNNNFLENKLIIITSHNLDFIKKVVNKILIIKDGKILKQYLTDELTDSNLIEILTHRNIPISIFNNYKGFSIVKKKTIGNMFSIIIDTKNCLISQIISFFEKYEIEIISIKKIKYDIESIYLLSQEGY